MARNESPQLLAGGNIAPSRFVRLSTSADNTALQAAAGNEVVGISGIGAKDPPGISGSSTNHAASGDNVELFSIGDIALLELGGTVARGDLIKSDANGKGVVVAADGSTQNVGARCLQSGVSGEFVRVQVLACPGVRVPLVVRYSASLDVASVAANTTAEQTFTVTGLKTTDRVFVNIPASLTAGLGLVGARVSAADTLALRFVNATAGALDPAAMTYEIVAIEA